MAIDSIPDFFRCISFAICNRFAHSFGSIGVSEITTVLTLSPPCCNTTHSLVYFFKFHIPHLLFRRFSLICSTLCHLHVSHLYSFHVSILRELSMIIPALVRWHQNCCKVVSIQPNARGIPDRELVITIHGQLLSLFFSVSTHPKNLVAVLNGWISSKWLVISHSMRSPLLMSCNLFPESLEV